MTAETTFADGSTRTAIDVRRFGWIRPLAGDYAFDFAKIAPLYAGDPSTRHAWTEAIARTRAAGPIAHSRRRSALSPAGSAAARRPARAMPPRKLADPQHRRRPDRPAGGSVRRPAVHPAQGHHRHPTRPNAPRASNRRSRPGVLGRRRGSRLGRSRELYGARAELPAADDHAAEARGRRRAPVASLALDARVEPTLDELADALGESEFSAALLASLRAAYSPGVGMAEAFARWLETLLGPYGLVVYESSDPAAKPLVADLFARELGAPGRTAALARRLVKRSPPADTSRRSFRSPTACRSFISTAAGPPIRATGRSASSSARTRSRSQTLVERPGRHRISSARTCFYARSCRTRCFRRSVTSPARASSRTWGSCAGSTTLRRPDAADVSARHRHARRLGDRAVPRRYDVPLESSSRRTNRRSTVCSSRRCRNRSSRRSTDAEDAMRRSMERVIDAMPAVDPTLAGAAKTTLAQDGARSARAAEQDDSGGQAARRDAAPSVHPRAGADVPARPSPGTHARRRLLPEPLRPGRHRTPADRNCRSSLGSTG